MSSRAVFRAGLLVAVAVALAAAAAIFRQKRTLADATVDDIEARLEALDPATRAAVVARLAKSAADRVRGREE